MTEYLNLTFHRDSVTFWTFRACVQNWKAKTVRLLGTVLPDWAHTPAFGDFAVSQTPVYFW